MTPEDTPVGGLILFGNDLHLPEPRDEAGLRELSFLITQIALFWFSYKYQESDDRKAFFYPHNNTLELIWTVIPAIALTVLVG